MTWDTSGNTGGIAGFPAKYKAEGVPFIQGGAMLVRHHNGGVQDLVHDSGDHFVLQVNDMESTMFLVHIDPKFKNEAIVTDYWRSGLGHERTGVAMAGRYLLSLGTRRQPGWSGENGTTAQIVAIEMIPGLVETGLPFGFGILLGIALVLFLRLTCWCCSRLFCGARTKRYQQTELANLARTMDEAAVHDDELL
eukprot:CAMPEP_0194042526 /NCGR_PEP_ID=MMETSP0009_2-20130614/14293_1 /TAXON_ID=210454 /ORGANISM="Grammatophora oceanica, Strain CCMP 410" /LENGTH=193 /DNA_ID=CAMNT_0038686401 /DNA_START=62 /DNA_END=643 /DNA_ORIENTATION=+